MASRHSLPVFLTEYGYGLLDRDARNTAQGRERQRAWFESTAIQARDLGISGAMAFQLMPYLERGANEFGLLMPAADLRDGDGVSCRAGAPSFAKDPDGGPDVAKVPEGGPAVATAPAGPDARWGENFVSPALATLLNENAKPSIPQSWPVRSSPKSEVVIDFVAGKGMVQAKNYGGYFLRGVHGTSIPGEGMLVLYDFGSAAVSGELVLEGDAWALATGGRRLALQLQPGERREVPVLVRPGQQRFEKNPVCAVWRMSPGATSEAVAVAPVAPTSEVSGSNADSRGLAAKAPVQALFEPYIRTKNGNLYQTWQRLWAKEGWQRYMERTGNFTMAFYGRANLPWRFADNEPAALVFFFRPEQLPATFEIRGAQVIEFAAPSSR